MERYRNNKKKASPRRNISRVPTVVPGLQTVRFLFRDGHSSCNHAPNGVYCGETRSGRVRVAVFTDGPAIAERLMFVSVYAFSVNKTRFPDAAKLWPFTSVNTYPTAKKRSGSSLYARAIPKSEHISSGRILRRIIRQTAEIGLTAFLYVRFL